MSRRQQATRRTKQQVTRGYLSGALWGAVVVALGFVISVALESAPSGAPVDESASAPVAEAPTAEIPAAEAPPAEDPLAETPPPERANAEAPAAESMAEETAAETEVAAPAEETAPEADGTAPAEDADAPAEAAPAEDSVAADPTPEESAPAEETPATDAAPAPEADATPPPSEEAPPTDTAPEVGPAPALPSLPEAPAAPETERGAALPQTETASPDRPTTAAPAAGLEAPQPARPGAGVSVQTDAPVLPTPQGAAPETPGADTELAVVTTPADPPPLAPVVEETADEAQPAAPPTEPSPESPTPAPAPVVTEAAPRQPAPAEETAAAPAPDPAPVPRVRRAGQTEDSATPGDLTARVTVNRLPSIGAGQEAPAAASEEPFEPTGVALADFAVPFENPEGKPLMAIVLIDEGSTDFGPEALESFPYPVTFALDPADPAATQRMQRYRDAGFEVMLRAALPTGASPADAEVAYEAYKTTVPEAVAMLMGGQGSGQTNPPLIAQTVENLSASGHGLVLYAEGLNTGLRIAQREGLPAGLVFRDFDAAGEDPRTVRRFLDGAAFRAGQEDGVIMVGRLRADTISALLVWGLQDRATRVALAPISAILGTP